MPTVNIKGTEYDLVSPEHMKRGQVKAFAEVMKRFEGSSANPALMEAGWEILELTVPALPPEVLDDLTLQETLDVLQGSGIMGDSDDAESIGLGESSASTGS